MRTNLRSSPARDLQAAATLGIMLLVPCALASSPLTGGSYVLIGSPAAGGTSSGGDFVLTGSVAASGAGTSTGGLYDLTSSIIGTYNPPADTVALQVALNPENSVRIWWPPEVAGYVLESSPTLGPAADWSPIEPPPASNSYVTSPTLSARFYRLRHPRTQSTRLTRISHQHSVSSTHANACCPGNAG